MTWYEAAQLIMAAVPSIIAVLGGILVAHGSYTRLQATVETLVNSVEALKPQAALIAKMQVDIELIKKDVATMRENQQAAAYGTPQRGKLPPLSTDDEAPRRTTAANDALEGRVDDLEEGIIKDLRIHKVDDPPEE